MFLKSKIKELKKITWATPKELVKNVGIVIAFSAFFTVLIFLLDMGITFITQLIYNLI